MIATPLQSSPTIQAHGVEPHSVDPHSVDPQDPHGLDSIKILNYLRRTAQLGKLARDLQEEEQILTLCQAHHLEVSEADLQAAGDAFRQQHQLWSSPKTLAWLEHQQMSLDAWTEGLRNQLLRQQLKLHLFSETVDAHYLSHRQQFQRVAFSQIVVQNGAIAHDLARQLREVPHRFAALALEYSEDPQSRSNGGFMGICFVADLKAPLAAALIGQAAGTLLDPLPTEQGVYLIKLETWLPLQLDEQTRQAILESLLRQHLQSAGSSPQGVGHRSLPPTLPPKVTGA